MISAILLAAGESTRLGKLKALLPWQGKTLLQHQINALIKAGVTEIIVVLGHQADKLSPLIETTPQIKVVRNPHYRQGKTTSIKAGLKVINPASDTILILGVDQPRSAATLKALLKHHQKTKALITIPEYRGKGGHPPIFSASLIPELMAITEEQAGLRAVINRPGREVKRLEMPSEEVLLDINTTADYERAKRREDT
ncbi:MAG: nucleotidyltransferase family protein [Chloroflexota bacterium]